MNVICVKKSYTKVWRVEFEYINVNFNSTEPEHEKNNYNLSNKPYYNV